MRKSKGRKADESLTPAKLTAVPTYVVGAPDPAAGAQAAAATMLVDLMAYLHSRPAIEPTK